MKTLATPSEAFWWYIGRPYRGIVYDTFENAGYDEQPHMTKFECHVILWGEEEPSACYSMLSFWLGEKGIKHERSAVYSRARH